MTRSTCWERFAAAMDAAVDALDVAYGAGNGAQWATAGVFLTAARAWLTDALHEVVSLQDMGDPNAFLHNVNRNAAALLQAGKGSGPG